MNAFGRKVYDDFYVAYLDSRGNVIYPSDLEDVKIIRNMLKNASKSSYVYTEDRNLCYKVRIKRKIIDGEKIQIVELSNVTEFFNEISNASVDEVTHLGNRKIARNLFRQYIDIAYKREKEFAIILADLDGFKNINDTYGHTNGDLVLSEVSRLLFSSTRQDRYREQDIVARIGGDEFSIVMKNVSFDTAKERSEKIRKSIENHKIPLFSEQDIVEYINAGTLSMGLYHVTIDELNKLYDKGYTTDEIRQVIMNRCDEALYQRKNNGKNKVTIYGKETILKL